MKDCHVAILLATKNGERFLADQLESYRRQSHTNWSLHVSDDASEDATVRIVQDFSKSVSQPVQIRHGPNQGHCANFMSLARDPGIAADYYAFSDQDDIWLDDKLERAVKRLGAAPSDRPALYCSRTELVDEVNQKSIGYSPLFRHEPGFANALVQNIGGGNTMVFNAATKRLLEKTELNVVAHDWWTYQIVTAVGGVTIYDPVSFIRYRQHGKNIVGSNTGWPARLERLNMLLKGQFADWNDTNIRALRSMIPRMNEENAEHLLRFDDARSGSFFFAVDESLALRSVSADTKWKLGTVCGRNAIKALKSLA